MGGTSLDIPLSEKASEARLDSWKEIAAYLNRDVTTVQRWERREGMPVHRHQHDKRGSVYALTLELDEWRESRRLQGGNDAAQPETEVAGEMASERQPQKRRHPRLIAAGVVAVAIASGAILWLRGHKAPAPRAEIRSIAVLPLKNLSADPTQEYLADGITEALIGKLSGVHDLRVISRTSIMRFKDTQLPIPKIAETLGVDGIVEGSVIRSGNRVRVTAQLIRAARDDHIWSETYDRKMSDVLALESEVAQSISERVAVTVTGQEQQRLIAARSVAPEVYESFLKGRFVLDKASDQAGIESAIGYFDDAVRRDPAFAPAYLGLAEAYDGLGSVFIGAPPQETRRKMMDAVRKALQLDPDLSAAHELLAFALQNDWRWTEAESEFRRAGELNPNDTNARSGLADWLLCQGHTDEAVALISHARELDPDTVAGVDVSWTLFQSRRYDEAIRELRSQLALRPDDPTALWFLGFVLIAKDEPDDAIPLLEKAADVSNRSPGVLGVLVRAYAHAGRRDDALRVLAELKKRRSAGYVPAAALVNAYLGLNDREEAFVWLEKAYQEKSNILQYIKVHPYFDPIRNDPRFADLQRRVGLN